MKKQQTFGQSLLEFALILPILLLIFLGIAEGAHIIQAYISLQNAAREAARYAVAGQPLREGSPTWTDREDRNENIFDVAVERSRGTGFTAVYTDTTSFHTYNDNGYCDANDDCAGVIAMRLGSWDTDGTFRESDPGIQGENITVEMYHNVAMFDPIFEVIVPNGFLRLNAATVMRNEGGPPVVGSPEDTGGAGSSGSPGTGPGGASKTPYIGVQDGEEQNAGTQVFLFINFHDANETYNIYVDGSPIGTIAADVNGNGIVPYNIPLDKTPGSYTIQSRALDGSVIAENTLTIIASTTPSIILAGGDTWPFGSVLEYALVAHDPGSVFDMAIRQGASNIANLDPLTTDASGTSVGSETYLLPNDGSITPGSYQVHSLNGATTVATRTLTLMEGCVKLNTSDCGVPITIPNGGYISIALDNHAPNRTYVVKYDNLIIEAETATNSNGQAFLVFAIPTISPEGDNGEHWIETYDANNPDQNVNTVIARTKVILETPLGQFIHVSGGYKWPAGSTLNFQLRNHLTLTEYDVYWGESAAPYDDDWRIIDDADATDGNGMLWLQYTIPITQQGTFRLHSKLHETDPNPDNYFADSLDITVDPSPYILVPEGSPQVPGADITIELHNHIANYPYDIYVGTPDALGQKLVGGPFITDVDGNATTSYAIPQTSDVGEPVVIRSYPKDNTTNMAAETEIDLVAADLLIESIELPAEPLVNQDVPITVTVINAAPVTITHQSFDVDVYLDPGSPPELGRSLPPGDDKTWVLPPLGISETHTFTTTLPIYGTTDHTIWARADTSNRIRESDEDNNLLSVLLQPSSCSAVYLPNDLGSYNYYGDAAPAALIAEPRIRLTTSGGSTNVADDASGGDYLVYREITGTLTPPGNETIVEANFDAGDEGFVYADDTFRGTSNSDNTADGSWESAEGFDQGGLKVSLGRLFGTNGTNMSGGWSKTFNLSSPADVIINFRYQLYMHGNYDDTEYSEVLMSLDGVLNGLSPHDYIERHDAVDGNEAAYNSGWQVYSTTISAVSAGDHTLILGGFNNRATENLEDTYIWFDDVNVIKVAGTRSSAQQQAPAQADSAARAQADRPGDPASATTTTGRNAPDIAARNPASPDRAPQAQVDVPIDVGIVENVGSGWTTVNLQNNYTNMVVVASPNYSDSDAPAVTRIQNAGGSSFQVKVQNPDNPENTLSGYTVHYIVVEEGVYTAGTHGVKMEAHTMLGTETARSGRWNNVNNPPDPSNDYGDPMIVLGQVMSVNDGDWSVFWARANNRTSPPNGNEGNLRIGKHVGEDSDTTRSDETLGYIIFEQGSGTINGTPFYAGLSNDIVRSVTNNPPYNASYPAVTNAGIGIVSAAAMDGGDGGWPLLYGANPVGSTSVNLAFDEDQIGDDERGHGDEQVAFVIFPPIGPAPNTPPIADAGPDQNGNLFPGDTVTLDGSGSSDPDSGPNPLSYSWAQTGGTAVTLSGGTTANPTFTPPGFGTYTFELTVSDGEETDTDTVVITIDNDSPVADAGPDQTSVAIGGVVTLDGSGSTDADDGPTTPLIYTWAQIGTTPSAVTLSDSNAVNPTFTTAAEGRYDFQLTVSDGDQSDTDTVSIFVANQPPIADAGPAQTVTEGDLVTLDGSGSSDPDNYLGSLSYSWSQDSGPQSVTLSGANTTNPTFDSTGLSIGTYVFRLIVDDGATGGTSEDTVAITISANPTNLPSEFEIQARLLATDTNVAGEWGLEIRSDNSDSDAAKITFGYNSSTGALQYVIREAGGAAVSGVVGTVAHPGDTPRWIRITKDGSTLNLYTATDAGDSHGAWSGPTTLTVNDLLATVYAGLYATSEDANTDIFDFDNFRICSLGSDCASPASIQYEPDMTVGQPVNDVQTTSFGAATSPAPSNVVVAVVPPAPPEPVDISGGTITMVNKGSATNQANDNDNGYVFAYHQIAGNFDVYVRAVSQEAADGTQHNTAKFGLSVRPDLGVTADRLDWLSMLQDVSGTRRVIYNQRENASVSSNTYNPGSNNLPIWLRMVRSGSDFTLYHGFGSDPDTLSWVEETTLNIDMAETVYLGVLNSSSDATDSSRVTLDNYHVCATDAGANSCGEVREVNGTVVLNAPNVVANVAGTSQQWESTTEHGDGRTGLTVPHNGTTYTGDSYPSSAPELQYAIDFSNTGTYYVWLLGYSDDNGANTAHVGLTDNPPHRNDFMYINPNDTLKWTGIEWNNGQRRHTIQIDQVGSTDISVWAREDGFELYQIILTDNESYTPSGTNIEQSVCSSQGVPDVPPGMLVCEAGIVNGKFEDDTLMSEWVYPGISQQVTRTSLPHYFAQGESFSMLLPATNLFGLPRQPWIYQEFVMPSWVVTPTVNGGTSIIAKAHVAVNPEGAASAGDLFNVALRDQTGSFPSTPISSELFRTGADTPFINPNSPDPGNAEWTLVSTNLAANFNPADYAGQTMRLFFESPNPSFNYSTIFYIDNVELELCTQEPSPTTYDTLLAGEVRVLIDGIPTEMPGVYVWAYAIDGQMQKTYTIHDSTFSFYNLPADPAGTQYIVYAEYEDETEGNLYLASTIVALKQGQTLDSLSLLLLK